MTFVTPLGLLALVAIPTIVAIHLFRRKFPPRQIAGLFLWQAARQKPESGGRISKLPITASLLLECLAALALALILAGATLSSSSGTRHLVVLLDDSASMSAVNQAGQSARDRAAARVREEMERLGPRGRITLVRSGERPSLLAGPAAFVADAATALDGWRPRATHHALSAGLRLAREVAGSTGELLVVSDAGRTAHGLEAVEGVVWAAVGERLANVGVTGAQRTIAAGAGTGTISLTLGNFSNEPVRRRLRISAGEQEILARDLEVPAGTSSVNLPIPSGLPPLQVALASDALTADDGVFLVEPRPQTVGIVNGLADGRGREALARALAALAGVTLAQSGHLEFAPAAIDQPAAAGTWRVVFGTPPASRRGAGPPSDFVGPFVLEKRHPLLLGVTLGGVVWAGATPLAAGTTRPIVSTGNEALLGMVAPPGAGAPTFHFNLDLDRTNLVRAPDWPILISNVVEMRRQELPGPERWNYRVGEWIRVRLGREPKGPLRFRCGGIERDLAPARLESAGAPSATPALQFAAPAEPCGVLRILEGDQAIYELGVNFLDETEGDLRDRLSSEDGAVATAGALLRADNGAGSDPLFWILLAVAAAAIMANWCWAARARADHS
jgi:Ca-activated chloride channel homolog